MPFGEQGNEESQLGFHAHITLQPDRGVIDPAVPSQAPVTVGIFRLGPIWLDAVILFGVQCEEDCCEVCERGCPQIACGAGIDAINPFEIISRSE